MCLCLICVLSDWARWNWKGPKWKSLSGSEDYYIRSFYMRTLLLFYMQLQAKYLVLLSTIQMIFKEINGLFLRFQTWSTSTDLHSNLCELKHIWGSLPCSPFWKKRFLGCCPSTKTIPDQALSDCRRVNLALRWSCQILSNVLAGPLVT